jgi:hypothetical protein
MGRGFETPGFYLSLIVVFFKKGQVSMPKAQDFQVGFRCSGKRFDTVKIEGVYS